jgi:hypothetical protein
MKTYRVFGLITILALLIVAMPMQNAYGSDVFVYKLDPSWTAPGGGGVFSAYIGPPAYGYVSPGATALYDGREAGIIKAGLVEPPGNPDSWDDGIFGFKPTVTIDAFAAGPLTYDVVNQHGENPVWITIEIDTGVPGDRGDNTVYQFVPTTNPAGWHTVDAAAGQWQKWADNMGTVTGPLMTLSQVAAAHSGLNVVRAYLRLGMGDSYYGTAGLGTVAWVDKATLGGVTYDFVVAKYFYGFFQPIDNGIVNIGKAGQAIPVKWRLLEYGVPVSDPASFDFLYSYRVSCSGFAGNPAEAIEEYAPGNSGLQYQGDGNWQFNWKTPKSYAGTCRAMYVEFSNGTTSPIVYFEFKK